MPDDFARHRDSHPVPCLVVVPVPRPGRRFEAFIDSSIPLLGVHSGHFVVLVERELSLAGISGVTTVTTVEHTVRATVQDPVAKVAVIDRIREDGAAILDVSIEESSLEDLFTAYTGSAPLGIDPGTVSATDSRDTMDAESGETPAGDDSGEVAR